jgi:hypothetical protein
VLKVTPFFVSACPCAEPTKPRYNPSTNPFGVLGMDDDDDDDVCDVYPSGSTGSSSKKVQKKRKTAVDVECPVCGKTKNLSRTAGQTAIAVTVSACPDFREQFGLVGLTETSSFRICRACHDLAGGAVARGRVLHPLETSFVAKKGRQPDAKIIDGQVKCGEISLVSLSVSVSRTIFISVT